MEFEGLELVVIIVRKDELLVEEDEVPEPGIVALEVAVAVVVLCGTVEGRPDTKVGPGILYDKDLEGT